MFNKDPDAILDYVIDWSTWLAGDTITASSWILPAGITSPDDSFTTATTTVWLSGGTAGEIYTITNRITTTGGRMNDQSIRVKVAQR